MKKTFFLAFLSLSLSLALFAQPGGGFQRRTPEERVAAIQTNRDRRLLRNRPV